MRYHRRAVICSLAEIGFVFAASSVFALEKSAQKRNFCPDRKAPEKAVTKGDPDKMPPIVIGKRADDIDSFDPHDSVSSSAAEILGNLYETLVVWNPAMGAIDPDLGLASSFTRSGDGLAWTFQLRPGRQFASGNPVRPEDVIFSLERLFAINGTGANILGPLRLTVGEDISPFNIDKGAVTITLPSGAPGRLLLPCLTAPVCSVIDKRLLEAHYAEDPIGLAAVTSSQTVGATTKHHDSGKTWLRLNSAGSGPFKIAGIDVCDAPEAVDSAKKGGPIPRDDEIVLQANPFYPGNSRQTRSVVVRSIADPVEQKRQLDNQDVQVAWDLSFGRDADDAPLTTTSTSAANLLLLCMNVEDTNAHLSSADVRKAIRCAINAQKLAHDLNSKRWSAQHEFCPSVICRDALAAGSLGTRSPFDQEKARGLLKSAGINSRIELTIDHIVGNPRSRVATLLANQLNSLGGHTGSAGFRTKLQPSSAATFLNRLQRREYQLALLTWNADYPDPHSNAYAFCANTEIENSKSASQDRTMAWYCRWLDNDLVRDAKAAGEEANKAQRLEKYRGSSRAFARTGTVRFPA